MLRYIRSHARIYNIAAIAAINGQLKVLHWLLEPQCREENVEGAFFVTVCLNAAAGGHLEVLKWARSKNFYWDSWTCILAALGGHLEVLKWARSNGCSWDDRVCAAAALGGQLEVLKWLHANGCPWDVATCSAAAFNFRLDVLQWLSCNNCPWDKRFCAQAAAKGELKVLAHSKIPLSRRPPFFAFRPDDSPAYEWVESLHIWMHKNRGMDIL